MVFADCFSAHNTSTITRLRDYFLPSHLVSLLIGLPLDTVSTSSASCTTLTIVDFLSQITNDMSAPRRASDAPECIDAVECILSFQCLRSFIRAQLRNGGGYIRMLTDSLEQAKAANRLPAGAVLGPKVSAFTSTTPPNRLRNTDDRTQSGIST